MVQPDPQHSHSTQDKSPTTPKAKKFTAAKGVPSMFASMTLSKPLKLNKAAMGTTAGKKWTPKKGKSMPLTKPSPVTEEKSQTFTPAPTPVPTPTPTPRASVAEPAKEEKPSTPTGTKMSASTTPPPSKSKPRTPSTTGRIVAGGSDSVAGTPRSWRKPYQAKSKSQSMPVRKTRPAAGLNSRFSRTEETDPQIQALNAKMDALIPAQYQKSPKKQQEEEAAEKEALYRKIAYELHCMKVHEEEERLRKETKDVSKGIDQTLALLQKAKRQNDFDDDASDATPKRGSTYDKDDMRAKLAHFTSNHGSDDDSSVSSASSASSWDSDDDDGLFRGY